MAAEISLVECGVHKRIWRSRSFVLEHPRRRVGPYKHSSDVTQSRHDEFDGDSKTRRRGWRPKAANTAGFRQVLTT